MALLARHGGMQASQRKSRDVVVEDDLLAPPAFVVALATAVPQLALVGIVFLMAARARGRGFADRGICLVAGLAFGRSVLTAKREFRRFPMIEVYRAPRIGRMARFTLVAALAGVRILNGMA